MPSVASARKVDISSIAAAYLTAVAIAAAVLPAVLAYNVPPSSTFFNQAAALIGWALVAVLGAVATRYGAGGGAVVPAARAAGSGLTCLVAALCIVAASAAASSLFGALPASLSLSAIGMIMATLVLIWAGATARRGGMAETVFRSVCIALVVAGVVCVIIACVQVFMPSWTDVALVARSESGRASGNLRQPNHLSSLVVWSAVAAVWLGETRLIKRALAAVLVALFVFTVALSASRTGILELVAMALWGAFDKRLSRPMRLLLVLVPVIYVASWLGMAEWAKAGAQVYAGAERLKQEDVSSSRFAIWSNAIELIKAQPWLGTGFGEFNLAWTLTPFPHRPVEFFDHPHNLVLHLATELGVPLAAVITALLCWALWRAFANSREGDARLQGMTRVAFVMVVTIAIHSMLEYPLWYAYFLLPSGLLLGLALGATPLAAAVDKSLANALANSPATSPAHSSGAAPAHAFSATGAKKPATAALLAASAMLVLASIASLVDYNRVVVIFAPSADAGPLIDRIEAGQKSVFFAHHADYAMATTEQEPPADLSDFEGAVHYLLDSRLMIAWAEAYARSGDMQRASYIAQRLREFHKPDAATFFEPCNVPKAAPKSPARSAPETAATGAATTPTRRAGVTLPASPPFQCVAPTQALGWRDFR